jgi:hypothetical protein
MNSHLCKYTTGIPTKIGTQINHKINNYVSFVKMFCATSKIPFYCINYEYLYTIPVFIYNIYTLIIQNLLRNHIL